MGDSALTSSQRACIQPNVQQSEPGICTAFRKRRGKGKEGGVTGGGKYVNGVRVWKQPVRLSRNFEYKPALMRHFFRPMSTRAGGGGEGKGEDLGNVVGNVILLK